jgi:conjugal transfer/entry exclusion protein
MIIAMTSLAVPAPLVSATFEEKLVRTPVKSENRTGQADALQAIHHLSADQLLQGIILSEVLGKPISLRRGHRRL